MENRKNKTGRGNSNQYRHLKWPAIIMIILIILLIFLMDHYYRTGKI